MIDMAVDKQRELSEIEVELQDLYAQISDIMTVNKESKVTTKSGVAEMVAKRSNSSTIIDPKKFRAEVSEEDFFATITVPVTGARKIIPERTLERISTKKEGKPKDPVLVVKSRT
jgi:hypothetical protein